MNKEKKISETTIKKMIVVLPILIFACVVPLIVKYSPIIFENPGVNWLEKSFRADDLFNFRKSQWIIFSGILAGFYNLYLIINKKMTIDFRNNQIKMIVAFIGILLVSTLFARHKQIAVFGTFERFEGLLVWLSYVSCAVYSGYIFSKENYRIFLFRCIVISGLLLTSIGFMQYIGKDLFTMDWYKQLVAPAEMVKSFTFNMQKGQVYSTLYNPNFAAMYISIVLAFAVSMIFYDKHVVFKVLSALWTVLLVINLIGTQGAGGFLGVLSSVIMITIVWCISKLKNERLKSGLISFIIIIPMLSFILLSNGMLQSAFSVEKDKEFHSFTKLEVIDGNVSIGWNKDSINIMKKKNSADPNLILTDSQGNPLNTIKRDDGWHEILNPELKGIQYGYERATDDKLYFILKGFKVVNYYYGADYVLMFSINDNGLKYVLPNRMEQDVVTAESVGFTDYKSMGTNRGMIWSRALPLISKSPIWGYGLDNFSFVYPQDDILAKYLYFNNPLMIIDKPHNSMLQMLISIGILGFALFYGLINLTIMSLFTKFTDLDNRSEKIMILGIMGSIGAFLGSGMFYDLNVNTSPIIWTFIGFGFFGLFNDSKEKINLKRKES